MRGISIKEFGGIEVMKLVSNLPKPTPVGNQVNYFFLFVVFFKSCMNLLLYFVIVTRNATYNIYFNPIVHGGGGGGGKFTPSRFSFNNFRNIYAIKLKFNINLLHTYVQNFRPIHSLLFKLCSIIEQVLENLGKKHCIMDIKGKYHNFW